LFKAGPNHIGEASVEDEVRSQSMLDLAHAVWARRKWIAVLAFVGPLAAVFSVLTFVPRLYEAKATILVDRQQMPESLVKATVSNELDMRLSAIHEEVLSRARLEELIGHFNLYPETRKGGGTKAAVDRLRQDIKLEKKTERSNALREPTTVGFSVSYRAEDPAKAAEVTNALARFYVVSNAKQRERQASATASFLKVELEQTKQTLDQNEKKVSEYKKRNSGGLPDQVQMNMLTIERLYSELRMNRDQQMRLAERAETPGAQGGIDLPPQQDRAAARLALLRQELAELATRYTDKYPDVVAKRQEIGDLEKEVANTPRRGAPVFAQPPAQRPRAADSRIAHLRTEEQQLLDRIGGYQKRLEETPRREQEFQEMARDYETTKELYRSLKTRYEEALLGENLETQHRGEMFKIVEPALPPDIPAAPRTARLAFLGLMASLGLAAVAVMVAEQVDTSYHSLDDLRAHVGMLPVAAAIPQIVTAADERRDRRRMHAMAACAAVAVVIIVALSWLIASGNYDLVALLARRG
jgi:polysaccharide chain length determinant protein (PEP-CTERM system associated)